MEANRTRLLGEDGFAKPVDLRAPLADVDIADARLRYGTLTLPPAVSRLRLKEWQHFCLLSPRHLITLAIVDAKFARIAWFQVVELETGKRFEHHRQLPTARVSIARSLWDERTTYDAPGFRLAIHNHLDAGEHLIDVDIAGRRSLPAVRASWRCAHDLRAIEPVVVSMPVGPDRCAYSHKVPLPTAGTIEIAGAVDTWREEDCTAILDIHKGHYPRHTYWKWATLAGRAQDGRRVAVNLTKNVVEDDATYNENAIWVDGKVTKLGPASFQFETVHFMRPWRLSSACGGAALTFRPAGFRAENLSVPGLFRSRFHQLYGEFKGELRVAGETLQVERLWGLCENHDSLW